MFRFPSSLGFVVRSGLVALAIALTPAGAPAQDAPLPPPTRLTNVINAYPHLSPDGSLVVFQSNRTGRYEIYKMDADSGGIVRLTDRPGDNVTPKWSPDGAHIVFASTPGGNSDIYLMNADGSNIRRLTEHAGDDSHPSWTADGSRIIFNSPRTTPDLGVDWLDQWHEVFSMDLDGGDLVQHTHQEAVCTYPSFSPDGGKIAYRKITDTPGFAWDLGNRERNSEVFVADLDGSGEINVSNSAAFDGWPTWSPDGTMILFASNRAGPANVGQLYVVRADGSGLRQLTEGPWSHAQPSWSLDGRWIHAYQLQETRDYEFGDVVVFEATALLEEN